MLTEELISQRARPEAGRDDLLEKGCANIHIESYPATITTTAQSKIISMVHNMILNNQKQICFVNNKHEGTLDTNM
jgi:hypothetical protein